MKPPGKLNFGAISNTPTWLPNRLAPVMKLIRQPTVLSSAVFAVSGALFAIGNLLLARTMPVPAFGRLALAVALFAVFGLLAPLGMDQLALRMRIGIRWHLALIVGATGGAMGGAVALVVALAGGLRPSEAAMVAVTIMAIGLNFMVSGVLRSEGRTFEAIPFSTGSSWFLFAIGCVGLITPFSATFWPLALFMVGHSLSAAYGWRLLFDSRRHREKPVDTVSIDWMQALSLLGLTAVGATMVQLERLIIPIGLGISDLALYAVLASVAIFPFRLLIQAADFTLTARLSVTPDPAARRALIRNELLIMALLVGAATVAVVLLVVPLTPFLTGGSYAIHESLVLAACLNGAVKLLYSLARAVVTVCGSKAQVAGLNVIGILSLVLASVGGILGAGWGLTGLILGVSTGGLVTAFPLWILASRAVRRV